MAESDSTRVDTTWQDDWFAGNQEALSAIDILGVSDTTNREAISVIDTMREETPEGAYGTSFALTGERPTNVFTRPAGDEEGMLDDLRDVEVSQSTMDKITPAIAIGAGEILTRARDFRIPEGFKPKIRAGGAKGAAFTLAIRANQIGRDFARNKLGMTEGASDIVGGASAYGAFRGIPSLINTISSEVKVGMATEVMDVVAEEAGKSAYRETMKQGQALRGDTNRIKVAANKASKEAIKETQEKAATEMKKRIGKEAAEGWGDVMKKLKNPNVSARVGRYLAHVAPKTAAKLALSSTAVAIPEGISTLIGLGGLAWTAYDIFNLAKQMPQLYSMIFEDTPEESIEDNLMDQMAAENTMFPSDEQRTPE